MRGNPIFNRGFHVDSFRLWKIRFASSEPKVRYTEYTPCAQQPAHRVPASVQIMPGNTSRPASRSTARTRSTTRLRGREMTISDLHWGQSILAGCLFRFREFGFSRSASQSRRQASWAVRAQGHGDRHSVFNGVSSVSSV